MDPLFEIDDLSEKTKNVNVEENIEKLKSSEANVEVIDLVKANTPDATPACMALLGPKVDEHIKDANFDQCGLLFDFQTDNGEEKYDYAKWMDLKCSQRTRSLMCTLLGISNTDISNIEYFKSNTLHISTHCYTY